MSHKASAPVYANFPAEKLTIGAGVAIFHLATERVVVCYHSRDGYWFLPKGRRNATEDTIHAAEREGFEESGYRNRVLPLPIKHRQPDPDEGHQRFVTEPLWTQLLPLTATSQYILSWYAAETVPKDVEESCSNASSVGAGSSTRNYVTPPPFPMTLTLRQRLAMDLLANASGTETVYEPKRHEGTGVDEDELLYISELLPIKDAREKLRGSVMEDVIRRAWEAVQLRMRLEDHERAQTVILN
ncbi:hypothetical protein BAUCODRAFT_199004 [Baudoinia panamericana UAMH 10762]|uniref:Nudix hydrolase domain-containing protein n=1 Tax=Baudoinia panamericana (strain UAMH 10762) TaxID=717646 RepID=M2NQ56_BAUPA|nr:uncharacterized protein BAUCODRAFT_199004 [Baudoinia panamericana UAMH 10762]EMD01156.1 hypothetical protein BAUCODRAFT_199004 [Baudoinia panamericana UAMH 10762]